MTVGLSERKQSDPIPVSKELSSSVAAVGGGGGWLSTLQCNNASWSEGRVRWATNRKLSRLTGWPGVR